METYNEQKFFIFNYQRRIWFSREIFCAGSEIFSKFEHNSPVCFKPDFFTHPPERYVTEIAQQYDSLTLSEPLFTYDQSPTKWGWRIQVFERGIVKFYIFIKPWGWYVKKIDNMNNTLEAS